MTDTIRPASIAELADIAARLALETHEAQPNPFPAGTPEHDEFGRRYNIAKLRLSAEALEGEASA